MKRNFHLKVSLFHFKLILKKIRVKSRPKNFMENLQYEYCIQSSIMCVFFSNNAKINFIYFSMLKMLK